MRRRRRSQRACSSRDKISFAARIQFLEHEWQHVVGHARACVRNQNPSAHAYDSGRSPLIVHRVILVQQSGEPFATVYPAGERVNKRRELLLRGPGPELTDRISRGIAWHSV